MIANQYKYHIRVMSRTMITVIEIVVVSGSAQDEEWQHIIHILSVWSAVPSVGH